MAAKKIKKEKPKAEVHHLSMGESKAIGPATIAFSKVVADEEHIFVVDLEVERLGFKTNLLMGIYEGKSVLVGGRYNPNKTDYIPSGAPMGGNDWEIYLESFKKEKGGYTITLKYGPGSW